MNYQEILESAFLDELEKIAALPLNLMGRKVLGATAKTWGKRALIGAIPGAIAGAASAQPGEGISGAVKGGVLGAGTGLVGGGLLQHRALGKIKGFKDLGYGGMSEAAKMREFLKQPGARKAYTEATRSALPGVV